MPEHSPNKTSTPIKVEDPNQFAPQGSDPKELKSKHKEVCMKRASIICDILTIQLSGKVRGGISLLLFYCSDSQRLL